MPKPQILLITNFVWDKETNILKTTQTRSGYSLSENTDVILIRGSAPSHTHPNEIEEVLFFKFRTYESLMLRCYVIEYRLGTAWGKTFDLNDKPLRAEIALY